ncbi:MAG: transglycosylase SLT domain-containing protein [Pseudomonadota bacterium]
MGRSFRTGMFLAILLVAQSALAETTLLDDQRAIFRNAWSSAERGEWILSARETELLKPYVLWPVLRGRYLEVTLATTPQTTIDAFLEREGTSRPARTLRYRYARHLARSGNTARYLQLYERYYAALGQADLDCHAVAAQIRSNAPINGALAVKLWLVGRSQHKACDPVFAWLNESGLLTEKEIRQRFELALAAREYNLARWLSKRLGKTEQATATRWQALRDRPAKALADTSRAALPTYQEELAYGIRRLAREDTEIAMQTWRKLAKRYPFDDALAAKTTEAIALIAAWRHEAHASDYMRLVPNTFASLELAEWRVRDALRRQDWSAVRTEVKALPDDEQNRDRWRYWHAVASQAIAPEAAEQALQSLASERSYYGFLAADRLGLDYALAHRAVAADTAMQTALAADPALNIALELHAVGLNGRARSAWDNAIRDRTVAEKRQAALLAADRGWDSRAIATLARAGEHDDLAVRYPVPWYTTFVGAARKNGLAVAWTYGIARSESLFMPDVRSPAGAVGVMQLMPATAKETARRADLPFRGLATLTNARSNITIGTRYLAGLAQRFDGHAALATAAYNAGPHRVDRWLAGADGMPGDIWVATIPFDETRGYVQRVLAAEAVFHWRLTDAQRRLSKSLPPIRANETRIAAVAAKPKRPSGRL